MIKIVYKQEKLINLICCGFLLFYFDVFVIAEKELKEKHGSSIKDEDLLNFSSSKSVIMDERVPFVGVGDSCIGSECNLSNDLLLRDSVAKVDTSNNYKIIRYICILLSDNTKSRENDADLLLKRLNDYLDTNDLPISFVEFYEKLGVFIIDIKSVNKEQDEWNLSPLIEGLKKIKKLDILNKADCTKDSILTEQSVFRSNYNNSIGKKIIPTSVNLSNTLGMNRGLLSNDVSDYKNSSQSAFSNKEPRLYKELDGYFLKKFAQTSSLLSRFKSRGYNNENSALMNTLSFLSRIGENNHETKTSNNYFEKNNSKITISPLYLMSLNNKNKNITEIMQNLKNQVSPIDYIDMSKEGISLDKDLADNIATAIFKGMSDSSSIFPPPFGNPSKESTINNSFKSNINYNMHNSPVISSWSYKPIPQGNSNYLNGFSNNEKNVQTGTDVRSNYHNNMNIGGVINGNNMQSYENSVMGFNNQIGNINNNQNTGMSQSRSGSGLAPVIFESIDNWGRQSTQKQQLNMINSNDLKFPSLNSPTTSEWMRKAITKQSEGVITKQPFISINDITVDNNNNQENIGNNKLNAKSGQINNELNNGSKNLFSNNYFNTPLTQASKLSSTQYGYFNPQNYGHSQGITFIKMNGSVFDDPNDITSFHPEEFINKLPAEVSNNMTQSQKDKINLINAFIGTGFDTILQMNNVANLNNDQYKTLAKRRLFELNSYNKTLLYNETTIMYENLLNNIDTNQGQDTAMAYVTGCDCKRFPSGIACPLVLSGEVNIQCIGYKVWNASKRGALLSDVTSAIESAINSNARNIVLPLKFDLKTIEENRSAARILRQIMKRTSRENNILFALPTGNNGLQKVDRNLDFPCDDLSGIYAFCVGSINTKNGMLSSFTNIPQISNTLYANGEDVESIGINQQKQLFSGTGIALAQSIGALNIIQGITKDKTTILDQLAILYSSPKKLPSQNFLEQILYHSNPFNNYKDQNSRNDILMQGMESDSEKYNEITVSEDQINNNNTDVDSYIDEIRDFIKDGLESNIDFNNANTSTNDNIKNIIQSNLTVGNIIKSNLITTNNNNSNISTNGTVYENTINIQNNTRNYNSTTTTTNVTSTKTTITDNIGMSENTIQNNINDNINTQNEISTNIIFIDNSTIKQQNIENKTSTFKNSDIPFLNNSNVDKNENGQEREKIRNLYNEPNYSPEILGVVLEPKEITEMSRLVHKSNEYYMDEYEYNEYSFDNKPDIPKTEENIHKMICYEEETRFYSPLEMAIPVNNIEQCILSCSNTPDCRYYSYGAFLKGPKSIVGTCILMPDKQGSVSLPNFQSGSLGCPVSASIAYAEAMEERLMNGISTVQENSKQRGASSNINSHLNSDWPGILSTSSLAVKSMSGFLSRFPLNDILQTSISLYNSGFLDQKGALRPSGAFEKQSVLPPPGVGSPHVVCTLQGMQCCVPQKSAKGWKKKPPSFLRVDHPSCEAIYISKSDMFCATTLLYDNENMTNLNSGYTFNSDRNHHDQQKSETSGNCGMIIIETSEHLIFQNTLKMPSKEMNNALCECKLNKRDKSIHGSGTWEYSVQAVQAAMNKKLEGDQLSTGVAQALAWVEAVGNDPNPAVNGLGELISQVAQRPNSDVELITQIPAISQNAVSNMLYNQQRQSNIKNNNIDNLRYLTLLSDNCITSWPEKCQVWKSKCEDNLIYGYSNPQCIPLTILENGCPMKQVGFKVNHINPGILSFRFRPMKFSDNSPFRIACQFSLVKCSFANVMHHCGKKKLNKTKKHDYLNLNDTHIENNTNIRKHFQNENRNNIDNLINYERNINETYTSYKNNYNNISVNYLPFWPKENNNNNGDNIVEKYIKVNFLQAGNHSGINMIKLFNNHTNRNFAAKIIGDNEIPNGHTVDSVNINEDSDFQYLGKVEIVPIEENELNIEKDNQINPNNKEKKYMNSTNRNINYINTIEAVNSTDFQIGKKQNNNISDINYFYGQEDELGYGYNFNYNLKEDDYDGFDDYSNSEPLLLDKYQPDITGEYYPEFQMEKMTLVNNDESSGSYNSHIETKGNSGWEIKLNERMLPSSISYNTSGIADGQINIFKYLFAAILIIISSVLNWY